ncbi:MAG: hypothetical protein BRD55_01510 [Bacteroidetes bacterium SW_9_63_38]|nr:MAG: hypothetical protein BRD55_01510 [Bacteroidetes bacterium SW_9_63_38]
MSLPDAVTDSLDRVAGFTAFTTVGALGLTQDLTHAVLESIGNMEETDPELVAEETLTLVATATARAAEVGLEEEPDHAPTITETLLALPFTYRDYLIGKAMVADDDPDLSQMADEVHERLQRKREFYTAHLPERQFPGPHALGDKMELWMGRVSPPKLPETPQERLASLDLVGPTVAHLKLVLAYGRRGAPPVGSNNEASDASE